MKHTYFKQLDHGIYSHIYEHIIGRRLDNLLFASGQLGFIDFDLTAESIALNAIVRIETYTDTSEQIVKDFFGIPSEEITDDEVLRAVKEVSIEYKRTYSLRKNSILRLAKLYNEIEAQPWIKYADLGSYIPPDNASYSSYRSQLVSYLDRDEKAFSSARMSILLDKDFWVKNREITPLATMLIASISQSFVPKVNAQTISYDDGDEWTYFDQYIRYVQHTGFEASRLHTIEMLAELYTGVLNNLLDTNYADRFVESFTKNYASREEPYYGTQTINEITQQIIGPKGWAKIVTVENTQKILAALKFEIKYKRKHMSLDISPADTK